MLCVSLFVVQESSGEVHLLQKQLDFGLRRNWKIVWDFMHNERVLCGSVFDDIRLALWDFERGRGLWRVDV